MRGEMPRYFFSIQAADEEVRAEYSAELTDDAAALAYACEIVRKRMRSVTHTNLNSQVTVRDETRPMVFSIPFLAASA
jgi:hypothetical protein